MLYGKMLHGVGGKLKLMLSQPSTAGTGAELGNNIVKVINTPSTHRIELNC